MYVYYVYIYVCMYSMYIYVIMYVCYAYTYVKLFRVSCLLPKKLSQFLHFAWEDCEKYKKY